MQQLADKIWTFEATHHFYGIEMGTRMTGVRLEDDGLWLHSPVPFDETVREHVDDLGEVRHIVAPNRFHHVYLDEWVDTYPGADLWAAPGLPEKRTDLAFDHVLTETTPPWHDQLDQQRIEGSRMLREVVFYHRPSCTLVTSDLFFNVHDPRSTFSKLYYWANGVLGKPGISSMVLLAYDDKQAARRSYEQLLDWDFERIVIAHGEIVDEDAHRVLRRVIDEAF
ncbi:MAG: DUF4336 domain-containing protein [Bradymonadaceae bacterium]